MSYREHLPAPALRHLVKCYWDLEDFEAAPGRRTVLPDGCMEIIVHFASQPRVTGHVQAAAPHADAFVGGQIVQALRVLTPGPIGMAGVRLWPWSGAALFGIAMHEITGQSVPLHDLVGRGARLLPDQLAAATGPEERFEILDALMSTLGPRAGAVNRRVAGAIQRLDQANGSQSVASLATALATSERHLNRLLKHHVGLSTKTYARIRRMQHGVSALRRGRFPTLTDAAHHAGYTDLSHFDKDLRTLCGVRAGDLVHGHQLLVETMG